MEVAKKAIERLKMSMEELRTRGMTGHIGSVWPVMFRHSDGLPDGESYEEYVYPTAFFQNLRRAKQMYLPLGKKGERRAALKVLLDAHISGEINTCLYHFGLFALYGERQVLSESEDFAEVSLGKRRAQYAATLPRRRFVSTDDFLTGVWALLIGRWDADIGEQRLNPHLNQLRLLFHPELFGDYVGRYIEKADWVEPIFGMPDLECKVWTGEEDPRPIAEGWTEGPIALGHGGAADGRHFVNGVLLHAGNVIQIKFGKSWIEGRYEWKFEKDSPIQIHAGDDMFYIREGHQVRVQVEEIR